MHAFHKIPHCNRGTTPNLKVDKGFILRWSPLQDGKICFDGVINEDEIPELISRGKSNFRHIIQALFNDPRDKLALIVPRPIEMLQTKVVNCDVSRELMEPLHEMVLGEGVAEEMCVMGVLAGKKAVRYLRRGACRPPGLFENLQGQHDVRLR